MDFSLRNAGRFAAPNTDEIQTGAFQRIADALEKLAGNDLSWPEQLTEKERSNQRLTEEVLELHKVIASKDKSKAALRGVITRIRRASR
jgi:hypothetical protein